MESKIHICIEEVLVSQEDHYLKGERATHNILEVLKSESPEHLYYISLVLFAKKTKFWVATKSKIFLDTDIKKKLKYKDPNYDGVVFIFGFHSSNIDQMISKEELLNIKSEIYKIWIEVLKAPKQIQWNEYNHEEAGSILNKIIGEFVELMKDKIPQFLYSVDAFCRPSNQENIIGTIVEKEDKSPRIQLICLDGTLCNKKLYVSAVLSLAKYYMN